MYIKYTCALIPKTPWENRENGGDMESNSL